MDRKSQYAMTFLKYFRDLVISIQHNVFADAGKTVGSVAIDEATMQKVRRYWVKAHDYLKVEEVLPEHKFPHMKRIYEYITAKVQGQGRFTISLPTIRSCCNTLWNKIPGQVEMIHEEKYPMLNEDQIMMLKL